MNMVMEFFRILLRMPVKEHEDERLRAVKSVDLEDSVISASRILRGRNSDMDFFPTPRTKKLRRP